MKLEEVVGILEGISFVVDVTTICQKIAHKRYKQIPKSPVGPKFPTSRFSNTVVDATVGSHELLRIQKLG